MTRLYLAHPTTSRHEIREKELELESHFPELELWNPFYDCFDRTDITSLDSGKAGLFSSSCDAEKLVLRDLDAIDSSDGLLAVLTPAPLYVGSLMEMFYAKHSWKPVITLNLSGNKNLSTHPWIRYCSDVIVESWDDFLGLLCPNAPFMGIGLTGKKRSGKDTVGDYLVRDYGFKKMGLAEKLKEITKGLFGFTQENMVAKPPNVRMTLQRFGTEAVRNVFPDAWVDFLEKRIQNCRKVLPNQYARIVVTDVRFLNEAEMLRRNGFILLRVEHFGGSEDDSHASETEQDKIRVDYIVVNDGDFDLLYRKVDHLLLEMKEQKNGL